MGICSSAEAASASTPAAHKGREASKTDKGAVNTNKILDSAGDVREVYTFDKVLGKGNFGVVHLVYDKKTNLPYACKSISKRKLLTADDIEDVRREVQILQHLGGHKNVVQIVGCYEDKSYVHVSTWSISGACVLHAFCDMVVPRVCAAAGWFAWQRRGGTDKGTKTLPHAVGAFFGPE